MYAGHILDWSNDNDLITKYGIWKESTIELFIRDQYYYVGDLIKETNFGTFKQINPDHKFIILFHKDKIVDSLQITISIYNTCHIITYNCMYNKNINTLIVVPNELLPNGSVGRFYLNVSVNDKPKKNGYYCDFCVKT